MELGLGLGLGLAALRVEAAPRHHNLQPCTEAREQGRKHLRGEG